MRLEKILDVRSPREFAYAHIPNALNFPVLSDQEHENIGTLYRKNAFEAKLLGSACICQNISNFLKNESVFHPKNKLILYCARGGQRSKSLWLILREIGFDCEKIEGGYKAYRQQVLDHLSKSPKQIFLTLYGMTGCGKSEIIKKANHWSIDLEGLSKHYGSSFGDQANGFAGQPSQAMFENYLDHELRGKQEVVLVEGESKKMGKIVIPHAFFQAIHQGIKITLCSSMDKRVSRIVMLYSQISHEDFLMCMHKIRPYIQKSFYDEVMACWDRGDFEKIAWILLEKYYDRVYRQNPSDFIVNSNDTDMAYKEVCDIAQIKGLRSDKIFV